MVRSKLLAVLLMGCSLTPVDSITADGTRKLQAGTAPVALGKTGSFSKPLEISGVETFAPACDGTDNDHTSILNAVRAARAFRLRNRVQAVAVMLPAGTCVIARGLPLVTGVVYAGDLRWVSRLVCTGSEPCFYTATESGGKFADSVNASYMDVATGVKESHSAAIVNLMIEHTGLIGGRAPSGGMWEAVIQAIGAPSLLLQDLFIVSETSNKHGVMLKYSWHSRLVGLTVPRQAQYSGGTGIFLDSESNAVLVERPMVYGNWAQCVDVSGSYALTIQSPSIERGCDIGILLSSGTQIVVDNMYAEGNAIDIRIGIPGSLVDGWEIRRGRFHGARSQVGIDIVAGAHGKVDRAYFDGTYAVSRYRMSGSANTNFGNDVHINAGRASRVDLAALGLLGGRNRVWVYGDDGDDKDFFRLYRTTDLQPIDSFARSAPTAFARRDTTPSVKGGNFFRTANSEATTITALNDCLAGQEVTILFADSNTTLSTAYSIKLSAPFTSTENDVIKLVCDGISAYEVSRSVN